MTVVPAEVIRAAAVHFLRGDTSIVDFTYAFPAAVGQVSRDRLLDGLEIELFEVSERWEASGSADRPAVVDQPRATIRQFVSSG